MDIPETHKRVYNLEQIYLRIGDQHEQLGASLNLSLLDPSASLGQETTFRLALITAFQFAESLPDSAAAEATMSRKDWQYALHLPLKHPGFSAAALCKFRETLSSSAAALHEMKALLDCLGKFGLYDRWTKETLDSGKAIAEVCTISRFMHLKEAMKSALSCLVVAHPDWLRSNTLPHWYDRYKTGRLSQHLTLSQEEMQEEAIRMGKDIQHLLAALNEQEYFEITSRVEIQDLTRLLKSEFIRTGETITWRQSACITCTWGILGPIRLGSPP